MANPSKPQLQAQRPDASATRDARRAAGKGVRDAVPPASHSGGKAPKDRPDP